MKIAISLGTYYSYLYDYIYKNLDIYNHIIEPSDFVEAKVQVFNDGEIAVKFPDSIRGKHVFIFGDTSYKFMELAMTVDAARRSSAGAITIVLPYYGYARQDKKGRDRTSIGAASVAIMLESLGADRIISIDLHSEQIQGFFKIAFEHLSSRHLFTSYIKDSIGIDDSYILCSPDAGGTVRVSKYIELLGGLPMVTMSKQRDKPGSVGSMQLIGDVYNKNVLLIDDIIDTGGTLIKAVSTLKEKGANSVKCIITHPILSNNAISKLTAAGIELITTNTRNLNDHIEKAGFKSEDVINSKSLKVIDCCSLLFPAIVAIAENKSVINSFS